MNKKILAIVVIAIVAVAGIVGALLVTGGLSGKPAEQDKNEDTGTATFEVASISPNREVLLVGDEFQVTVDVKNTGTKEGNYTANLTSNNKVVSAENITLKAGETKRVLFDLVAEAAGNVTMSIENATATVSIYEPVSIGDYRTYHLEGYDADLGQPIDETITYTVIAMDATTYTTRIAYEGSSEAPTEVVSLRNVDWSTGRVGITLVGMEGVSTYLGAMNLDHYRQVSEGLTYDYYVHAHANLMIKTTVTDGASTMTQTLVDTNCAWLADV